MKKLLLFLLLFSFTNINAQTLPINFEDNVVTITDFEDFDGGTATVIPNPQSNGINTSATVAQIVREGGTIWSGSKILMDDNIDFSVNSTISMKVFCTAPVGTIVKLKLEGNGQTEIDVPTTVTNEWETLSWDFTGTPMDFNYLVFMFDFGNVGDGSASSTFLFDDIEQVYNGEQIDLPVSFEESSINYTVTDFGGNSSTLIIDPTDPNNQVIQSIKTDGAATWAGTTIGTPAGFAQNIPLTLNSSKMTVRVWSPTAGTPIRLKVEDHSDPTHTCETETITTLAGEWEMMEFDFSNEAPGTAALSFGLDNGWTFNMASIFFNFGTDGATSGEATYFFDDVNFIDILISTNDIFKNELSAFPNPTIDQWRISSEGRVISAVQLFDGQGRDISLLQANDNIVTIDASDLIAGIYFAKVMMDDETLFVRLIKGL